MSPLGKPRSRRVRNGFAVRAQDQQDDESYPAWWWRTYRLYKWTAAWGLFCLTMIAVLLAIDVYHTHG